MTDVDADALKDLVRRANFLPYLSYGSPHDLSILEKISGYYVAGSLVFLGLTLVLNSLWGVVALVPLLVVMHYGVILCEERYLVAKFGESYRQYCAAVRRYF